MKTLKQLALFVAVMMLSISCEKENNDDGSKVHLLIKRSISNLKSTTVIPLDILTLNSFKVNISEIEFDLTDESEEMLSDSIIESQELNGPFLLDLMDEGAVGGLLLGTTIIPNAKYEEVEFDFEPSKDQPNTEMYGNSIIIKGTFKNKQFIIKTDKEMEMEIEFPNQTNMNLTGQDLSLFIEINIAKVMTTISNINFDIAKDGNTNGIIEITSDNTDGNKHLLDAIVKSIEESIEIDEESINDDEEND